MSRLLIIEDELLIAAMTEKAATGLGYQVIAKAKNLQQSFSCLQEANFDIAAVDINLGKGLEGLEIGKELQKMGIPFFYLTSYESGDIIRKASETNPGTYLIKPFNPAQLLAALEISLQNSKQGKKEIVLEDGAVRHQLFLNDILFVQAKKMYIDIRTNKKLITLRMSLKSFLELVPEGKFLQPHRSYLVNSANITRYNNTEIKVEKFTVPIARSSREAVLQQLQLKF